MDLAEARPATLPASLHRIDTQRFHRMIEAGVFAEGERVEPIDAAMYDMPPTGPPHGGTTNSLTMLFAPRLAGKAVVSVQGPLDLDAANELYPDPAQAHFRDREAVTGGPVAVALAGVRVNIPFAELFPD